MDTQKQITPEQIAEWRKVPPDTRYNVAEINRRRHTNDNLKMHKKRGRSQVKYARRPEGWKEWIAVKLLRRAQKPCAVIPVELRPWVPKYRDGSATLDTQALLKLVGKKRYAHLAQQWGL